MRTKLDTCSLPLLPEGDDALWRRLVAIPDDPSNEEMSLQQIHDELMVGVTGSRSGLITSSEASEDINTEGTTVVSHQFTSDLCIGRVNRQVAMSVKDKDPVYLFSSVLLHASDQLVDPNKQYCSRILAVLKQSFPGQKNQWPAA